MTVSGVKEGTTKPKHTVDEAEYYAKRELSLDDDKYKELKRQEKMLHDILDDLRLEKEFLENSFKAYRTIVWKECGKTVTEAIG